MLWLTAGLALAGVPELVAAEAGSGIFQWRPFLGPFHSVVLHFPIGFVVMAFLVDLYALWRRKPELQAAITLTLSLSVLTTVLTIVLGLMRASGAEYDPLTLAAHRNYGIAVGALTLLTLLLQWLGYRDADTGAPRPFLRGGYRVVLLTNIALLVIAGHEGGNLTHGSNYLTKNAPEFVKALVEDEPGPAAAAATTGSSEQEKFYLEKVKPLFDTKCLSCHGPEKQKGKYRIDQPALALKGGDSDKLAVKPGDPFASNLVRLLLLPPGDDVMPPAGKGSLTPDEVMHVIRWIQQGAPIPGHKTAEAKPVAPEK